MKNAFKLGFLFLLISFTSTLSGQKGIELTYNSVHSGTNVSLGYIIPITKNIEVSLGGKYHLNRPLQYDDNSVFFKTGHANQLINRFGAKTRITRKVNNIRFIGNISFSLVSEYANLHTRTLFNYTDPENRGKNLFQESNFANIPNNRIENNLVISKDFSIHESFSIVLAGGGGIAHLWGKQFGGITWEFSPYLSAGVKWSLPKV